MKGRCECIKAAIDREEERVRNENSKMWNVMKGGRRKAERHRECFIWRHVRCGQDGEEGTVRKKRRTTERRKRRKMKDESVLFKT